MTDALSAGPSRPYEDDDAVASLAFAIHSNPAAHAFLIGAGVSIASGVPSAYQVLEDLTSRLAQAGGASPDDPIGWFEQTYGEHARYQSVLQRLGRSRVERQRLLRPYFEREQDPDAPVEHSVAYAAVARLVASGAVRVIVTLNFDRLIEQALRSHGIEPTVISTAADIRAMAPLHTQRCCVIHLHGDYLSPESMRNTDDELATYDRATNKLLRTVLADYGLVIAGWSGTYDPALRAAIKSWGSTRLVMRWFEPFEPSADATELRNLVNGILIKKTADEGIGALADTVESMNLRQARHPLTVATAVETAKRELTGRWVAIGLHDRIASELARLNDHDDFRTPNYQARTVDGVSEVEARVREAAAVPAALVATAARWGSTSTDQWWLEEITRFSTPRRGSGDTFMLSVRLIAGSTLFWAAGVAATAARRDDLVQTLLNLHVQSVYSSRDEPVISVLAGTVPAPYRHVRPILAEVLAAGDDRIDEAWQRFEVLAYLNDILRAPDFEELSLHEREVHDRVVTTELVYETASRSGQDTGAIQTSRHALDREHGLACGTLADRTSARTPHVYAARREPYGPWTAPVVNRLIREVEAKQDEHELAKTHVISPDDLLSALRGVNVAIGRIAARAADNRLLSAARGVSELWVDTGLTYDETHERQEH